MFKWLVIGHLAEAEAELLLEHEELANEIREYRKEYEFDSAVNLPLMELIERITILDDAAKEEEAAERRNTRGSRGNKRG